jgi:hypothetical protein
MEKFYRVLKENPLWEVGAIINGDDENDKGYSAIDPVFEKGEYIGGEYLSWGVIENSPEYFQRVYKLDTISKVVYETRDKVVEALKKGFKPQAEA